MSVRFRPMWLAALWVLRPGLVDGQVLFIETFNDGAAAGRWSVREDGDNGVPDSTAQLSFDYSTLGIAPAPRGTGTVGAKLDSNVTGTGGAQGINIFPLAQSFAGDFVLRLDVWSGVAGDPANSTEDFLVGINATGTRTNWLSIGGPGSDGLFYGVTGNGGNDNGFDYIRYIGNVISDPVIQPLHDNTDPLPAETFRATSGTPQNQWATVDIEQINGVIGLRINGMSFDQFTNSSSFVAGNIFLGHQDVIWTGQGNPSTFSIFDNVSVSRVSRWTSDTNSSWTGTGNWSVALVNSADAIAYFGPVITAARTVDLPVGQTVGQLVLDSTAAYTFTGPGWLTLSAVAGKATLEARRGSHTVATPVVLEFNTRIEVTRATDTLTFLNDPIIPSSISLSKTGAGTLQLPRVRVASLTVQGGGLRIASKPQDNTPAATSLVQGLWIPGIPDSPLGCIDLSNQSLIIDYSTTFATSTLRRWLRVGLLGGKGIISSSISATKRLGYFSNTNSAYSAFAGIPVDATSVLIGFTYAGDANLDGKVDLFDLVALSTHWQLNGYWYDGDFNYDGVINAEDLGLLAMNWQAGVNGPLPLPGSEPIVPEPRAGILLVVLLACTSRLIRVF